MYASDTRDSESSSYIAKVYSILTIAVGITASTAYLASTYGEKVAIDLGKYGKGEVAPAVHFCLSHPILLCLSFLALGIMAAVTRKMDGLGPAVLGLFSVSSGFLLAPSIVFAQIKAAHGGTLSGNPVRDAGILTVGAFVGLSAYALASRKDFNYLGAGLFTGLLVVIGAGLLNVFLGSAILGLAIASVTVIVFVGYILYDTSNLIHGSKDDPIGDATQLYLDVLNLFSALLRILASSKSD